MICYQVIEKYKKMAINQGVAISPDHCQSKRQNLLKFLQARVIFAGSTGYFCPNVNVTGGSVGDSAVQKYELIV